MQSHKDMKSTKLRLAPRDPRPRARTFYEFRDDDDNPYGVVVDHAPAIPIIHMAILGNWRLDHETLRLMELGAVRQTRHKWQYLYVGFIDSDEQAYFLSICDTDLV